MSKAKDPAEGLEDDASKGIEIKDPDQRRADQLEYFGGDPETEDELEDLTKLDRGDGLEEVKDDDRGDDVSEDSDEEESEEESKDDEEGEGEDETEGSEGDSADEETEDEDSDEGDKDGAESDEDESEDDEPAAEDDVEEEEEEEKPVGIPRKRFNEVNQRMKDAEAELIALRAEKTAGKEAAEETFDFDAAEDEYMVLLLDGKTKEAGGKRREIRAAEMEQFKSETAEETTTLVDEKAMTRVLKGLSGEAEKMFPIFDPDSENFNPDAVGKVLTFMKGYELGGMPSDDAFVTGLADAMEIYNLVQSDEETESQGDEKKEDEKPGKKVTKKAPITKVAEKIAASKQQGKSPAGQGDGSSDRGAVAPNIEDMTDEEMDALPPEMLARMRGDLL